MNRNQIFERLGKLEDVDKKIKFLEYILKKLKDEELIKELQELLEDLKSPDLGEVIREERFPGVKLETPKQTREPKEENLEQIARQEPVAKETKEEKKYKPAVYEARKELYDDTKIESPFFDTLKFRLDRAGLLPHDMIFREKDIKDIKLYMQGMKIPEDSIEKYINKLTDFKQYESEKGKNIEMFNVEYERE